MHNRVRAVVAVACMMLSAPAIAQQTSIDPSSTHDSSPLHYERPQSGTRDYLAPDPSIPPDPVRMQDMERRLGDLEQRMEEYERRLRDVINVLNNITANNPVNK